MGVSLLNGGTSINYKEGLSMSKLDMAYTYLTGMSYTKNVLPLYKVDFC